MNNVQFPRTYFLHLLEQVRINAVAGIMCGFLAVATLPAAISQPNGAVRFYLNLVGIVSCLTAKNLLGKKFELEDTIDDLKAVNARQQISWYGELLSNTFDPVEQTATVESTHQGRVVNLPGVKVTSLPNSEGTGEIKDFTAYWLEQNKHLMIVGGTGDGKSTLIKALQTELTDWDMSAYDVDYAAGDYLPQVAVFYTYEDIAERMKMDVAELQSRYKERRAVGSASFTTDNRLIVAEELPSIVQEVKEEAEWIRTIGKRGRKVGMFIAACVQNDTIENTGLKGDNKLRDSSFVRVYLGNFAKERARTINRPDLLEWVSGARYGRFIVDDRPCQWLIH